MEKIFVIFIIAFWTLTGEAQTHAPIKEGEYKCVQNYYDTNRVLLIKYLDNSSFLFIVTEKSNDSIKSIYSPNTYFGIGRKATHNELIGLVDETPLDQYISAKQGKTETKNLISFKNQDIFSYANDTLTLDYTDGRCFICGKYVFMDTVSKVGFLVKKFTPLQDSLKVSLTKQVELFDLPMKFRPKKDFLNFGAVVYLQNVYKDDFFVIELDQTHSIRKFGWINSNAVHFLPETLSKVLKKNIVPN